MDQQRQIVESHCSKSKISLLLGSYYLVGFVEIWFSNHGRSYFHRWNGVSNSWRLLFENRSLFLAKCESTWLMTRHGYGTHHALELIFNRINYYHKASKIMFFPAWTQQSTHCGALKYCSLRSVKKKTTYKPTYVRKNVPEATRKKKYMASNGQ